MQVDGIILVRSSSSRLKKKCYLKFGNKTNIIEHIIKRCKFYKINPIICTTINKVDNQLIVIAKKNKVKFFRGSARNKISRISECCSYHNIDFFHTIDADDPFFCGHEVLRSIKLLKKGYNIIKPSMSSADGGASVGFSATAKIFHNLNSKIKKNVDTEMMWKFFDLEKDIKVKVLPKQKYEIKNCRLTLDYYEDYVFLNTIRELLGKNTERKDIYNLLKKKPELSKINFFRNKEWKKNQKKLI